MNSDAENSDAANTNVANSGSGHRASVIVVSRHRAAALVCCLKALMQQDHRRFEVIVVADPDGCAAARDFPVRIAGFDMANISAARNIGLAMAAADVVAFIDDDAVAEPTWLSRLSAAFDDESVLASTGFVRGRNGISWQWKASEVDAFGQDHPFEVPESGSVHANSTGRAVKTQGTNCAFRRDAVLAIGGFDPAFRFYLDEADVNLRLGGRTAVVPSAQVHHGFAASSLRRADRVPLSLHEIAASTAVFLRRHAAGAVDATALRASQTARVAALRISTEEKAALIGSLEAGWADGMTRDLRRLNPIQAAADADFRPIPNTGPKPGLVLSGHRWSRARLRRQAVAAAGAGKIVTVFCWSLTARYHRMSYDPRGFWWQEGGQFGRSDRAEPLFRFVRFNQRVARESRRLDGLRPLE